MSGQAAAPGGAPARKVRNIERDPRVALSISDPADPRRYFRARGRVLAITGDGAAAHIDKLSHRYLGTPYPWFGGRDQVRPLLTIEPDRITTPR